MAVLLRLAVTGAAVLPNIGTGMGETAAHNGGLRGGGGCRVEGTSAGHTASHGPDHQHGVVSDGGDRRPGQVAALPPAARRPPPPSDGWPTSGNCNGLGVGGSYRIVIPRPR